MKIAIVGSHWTWKSTLLEYQQTGLPKIKEVARDIVRSLWKKPQDMSMKELIDFQTQIYEEQIKQENMHKSFISDRWIYDNLAYAKNVAEPLYDLLSKRAKEHHKWYDYVFYTPIEFELEDDNVRFTDLDFQRHIDESILSILDVFNVDYYNLSGSVDERLETMDRIIK